MLHHSIADEDSGLHCPPAIPLGNSRGRKGREGCTPVSSASIAFGATTETPAALVIFTLSGGSGCAADPVTCQVSTEYHRSMICLSRVAEGVRWQPYSCQATTRCSELSHQNSVFRHTEGTYELAAGGLSPIYVSVGTEEAMAHIQFPRQRRRGC